MSEFKVSTYFCRVLLRAESRQANERQKRRAKKNEECDSKYEGRDRSYLRWRLTACELWRFKDDETYEEALLLTVNYSCKLLFWVSIEKNII